jgi:hypothetical protein
VGRYGTKHGGRNLTDDVQVGLSNQVSLWNTVMDFPSSHPAPATSQRGVESSPNTPTSRRRLNPNFVDMLMSWPPGWTSARHAFAPEEMAWYRSRAQRLLSSFFGDTKGNSWN